MPPGSRGRVGDREPPGTAVTPSPTVPWRQRDAPIIRLHPTAPRPASAIGSGGDEAGGGVPRRQMGPLGSLPLSPSPVCVGAQRSSGDKLSSTAGSRESPYLASAAGPVGLPSPSSRQRNLQDRGVTGRPSARAAPGTPLCRAAGGQPAVPGAAGGTVLPTPRRSAAGSVPFPPPPGCFAGTAERSPVKQIRSGARPKWL